MKIRPGSTETSRFRRACTLGGNPPPSPGHRTLDTPDRLRSILASYGDEEDINSDIICSGEGTVVTGAAWY